MILVLKIIDNRVIFLKILCKKCKKYISILRKDNLSNDILMIFLNKIILIKQIIYKNIYLLNIKL